MDYIDVNVIADRIKRNPLLEDIPYETIIDYAVEFIKIMGVPQTFFEKTAVIEIEDYRGQLPCDFYSIIQARIKEGPFFRGSTDSFHMSPLKEKDGNLKRHTGLTYKIQGSMIYTSTEKCTMEIAYRAFPADCEGLPLIPDNGTYPRALQEYVVLECYTTLHDQNKISPRVLDNHQQRYAFYAAQARTDLVRPTIDQMESIANSWNRLLPSRRDHNNGYVSMGAKEHLKIH